jgi:hypothetical protein
MHGGAEPHDFVEVFRCGEGSIDARRAGGEIDDLVDRLAGMRNLRVARCPRNGTRNRIRRTGCAQPGNDGAGTNDEISAAEQIPHPDTLGVPRAGPAVSR